MRILAIDPGKRSIAWAMFLCGELREVGFVTTQKTPYGLGIRDMLQRVSSSITVLADVVVVEIPRVYPKERNVRPNDLIDITAVAGACTLFGESVCFVHPRTWKGQVPKDVMQYRLRQQLDRQEIQLIQPYEKNHNVWDAVGIGRWYLEEHNV